MFNKKVIFYIKIDILEILIDFLFGFRRYHEMDPSGPESTTLFEYTITVKPIFI